MKLGDFVRKVGGSTFCICSLSMLKVRKSQNFFPCLKILQKTNENFSALASRREIIKKIKTLNKVSIRIRDHLIHSGFIFCFNPFLEGTADIFKIFHCVFGVFKDKKKTV